MQKKDSYLQGIILVGCLFLLFCLLTYRESHYKLASGVTNNECEKLYIVDESESEMEATEEQTVDVCNSNTKRSNLFRGKVNSRNKGIALVFVLFVTLCLWKQTSSFYFKVNNNNNLNTFNVYETPVRRGPPIAISM